MAKEKNEPPKFPEIGARLSQFVKDSGEPSARQFALKARITPAVLSNLMLGHSIPGGETLAAIAAAYSGFDVNWLLTGGRARLTAIADAAIAAPVSTAQEPEALSYGDAVELAVANARIADRDETIRQQQFKIDELNRELGKPFNGLDAAGSVVPSSPRTPIGFGAHKAQLVLSVSRRVKSPGAARPL
jgi:transcriptional regulator with XRE-family HTH domain